MFASSWCLRTRSARVSASWMSISSNKSSHEAQRRLLPARRLRQYLGWTFRHESLRCMRCRQARKNGPRSVSVCPATLLFIGRRALLRSEASMRRRQHLGWTFRLGTRWASGQLEGARRRAGTHPRLRQQGPEPARRGEQRQEEEQASGGAGSEAIDRQTRGCRLCRVRIFGAKIFDIGKTVGPHRWRCVASLHTRCLKSAPIAAVTKKFARFVKFSRLSKIL